MVGRHRRATAGGHRRPMVEGFGLGTEAEGWAARDRARLGLFDRAWDRGARRLFDRAWAKGAISAIKRLDMGVIPLPPP